MKNPLSAKFYGAGAGAITLGTIVAILQTYWPALHSFIPISLQPWLTAVITSLGALYGAWKATHQVTTPELQRALQDTKTRAALLMPSGGPVQAADPRVLDLFRQMATRQQSQPEPAPAPPFVPQPAPAPVAQPAAPVETTPEVVADAPVADQSSVPPELLQ